MPLDQTDGVLISPDFTIHECCKINVLSVGRQFPEPAPANFTSHLECHSCRVDTSVARPE